MPAISPAELEARLRLHLLPELGPRRLQRLLSAFPDAASALSAPASAWRSGKIYLMQCGTKMRIRQQKKSAHYCE